MNLPLTFEHRISVSDHCASHLVCQANNGALQKSLRRSAIRFALGSAAFAGAAALGWWLKHAGVFPVPSELITIGGLIGTIGLCLSAASVRSKPVAVEPSHTLPERPEHAKWERHPMFRGCVGPTKLEITDVGVTETRRHTTLHVDWEEIDRVHRGPAHLFIATCTGAIFTLPHRAASHLNMDELCRIIEEKIDMHRPPDVEPAPRTTPRR